MSPPVAVKRPLCIQYMSPASGGFAPRPPPMLCPWTPLGSFRPQTPCFVPPLANFWLRPCKLQLEHQSAVDVDTKCHGRAELPARPPPHPRHFQHHFRRNARTRLVLEARPVSRLLTLAGKHSTAADNNPRARTALPRLKQLWTSAVQCVQGHKGHGPQNFSWPLITSPPLCTC